MKPLIAFTLILFCFCLGAINYPNMNRMPHFIDGRKIPNVKPIMGDYLYMALTEVSNYQYVEFLYWLKREKPNEYIENLPDSNRWREMLSYNEPFVNNYLRHPSYQDYPTVNISQKQAENYCQFIHWALTRYFKETKNEIEQFIVRLPTEKEWMLAARGGLPESAIYPWGTDEIRIGYENKKHRGEFLLNFRRYGDNTGLFSRVNDHGFITTPVFSYYPNGYGLYNMSGNVAEWVAEKGKTKGGSWNLPPYNARINVPGYYDGDSTGKSDIGFRYVIEIVSVKDKPIKNVHVDAKYLSKDYVFLLKDSTFTKYMYASDHELTNKEYNLFLRENNLPEYQIQSSNWSYYFPYKYYEMYGWHSAYDDYPVVNISHKAAKAYCEWATEKYNKTVDRQYKKVIFRLPTGNEWEYASRGGWREISFPRGGPYTRNTLGCYLCNYAPFEEQYLYKKDSVLFYNYPNNDRSSRRCIDGLLIPGKMHSYFPNDYGIYNCSGNVAEMIDVFGITRGGSWNSDDSEILIVSQESYTEPSPNIGFRVFMEVLQR